MKGRPQDFMRVGMIHFMAYPQAMKPGGPVVETLQALCADDYFSLVEVTRIPDAATRARAGAAPRARSRSPRASPTRPPRCGTGATTDTR